MAKNEKAVKHFTHEEIVKMHEDQMRNLLHSFLKETNDTWPELKTWDYRERYAMPIDDWRTKYDISRKFSTYSTEHLLLDAVMKGAPHEDLVRIMKFMLVLVDYVEFQLDEGKARIELGIPSLKKKYLNGGKH